jgi:hydrogenase maturation factor
MLDANIIKGDTVISHNLAIGVPLQTLGFFAFHYAVSNVAMRFAKPNFVVVGIYLPQGSTEKELEIIAIRLGEEIEKYDVRVIAGHTGVYKGLNAPLVSVTCLGRVVRKPDRLLLKDHVLIAGDVGKEALWLRTLEKGCTQAGYLEPSWKLTPLPLANALMHLKDVKLMHDVSEGGVAGALYEVAESVPFKLEVHSNSISFYEGAKDLDEDPLKIPSYGALILLVGETGLANILNISKKLGYPCSVVGSLEKGKGLFIDGIMMEGIKRTRLDEIYGSFKHAS